MRVTLYLLACVGAILIGTTTANGITTRMERRYHQHLGH